MYIYIYIYTCVNTYVFIHVYTCVCIHVCKCISTYIYAHIYICVCMYIYMHIYIYIHIHIYICIYVYMHTFVYIHKYVYLHTYKFIQYRIQKRTHIYIYAYIYMYIYIYIYSYTYTYTYMYVYAFIDTHAFTHTHPCIFIYLHMHVWIHLPLFFCYLRTMLATPWLHLLCIEFVLSSVWLIQQCVCVSVYRFAGLRACLDKADEWEFNVFELEKESDGLPLQVLCWHLFTKHNLIEEFQLDQVYMCVYKSVIYMCDMRCTCECYAGIFSRSTTWSQDSIWISERDI